MSDLGRLSGWWERVGLIAIVLVDWVCVNLIGGLGTILIDELDWVWGWMIVGAWFIWGWMIAGAWLIWGWMIVGAWLIFGFG